MHRILLVEPIHSAGMALLAEKAQVIQPRHQTIASVIETIADCDALITRNTRITSPVMEAGPRLKVIGRHGVGYDTIDITAATRLGIPVVYTPAANTESVAEIAVAFILCLGRKLLQAHTAMRSEVLLSDTSSLSVMAQRGGLVNTNIRGKTLGIIGVGRIGSSVARKMAAAFDAHVLGYDPYVDAVTLAGYGVQKVDRLEDLLPRCDFVTLHCPGGQETRHMLNARTLALMKPGAYLINTARGSIVDEAALVNALAEGRLAGAAIDVYDPEPPIHGCSLVHMPNVIVTPHYCAMTEESLYNMATMVAQGVMDVLEGNRPAYIVNCEVWDRRRA